MIMVLMMTMTTMFFVMKKSYFETDYSLEKSFVIVDMYLDVYVNIYEYLY